MLLYRKGLCYRQCNDGVIRISLRCYRNDNVNVQDIKKETIV